MKGENDAGAEEAVKNIEVFNGGKEREEARDD